MTITIDLLLIKLFQKIYLSVYVAVLNNSVRWLYKKSSKQKKRKFSNVWKEAYWKAINLIHWKDGLTNLLPTCVYNG